MLQLTNFRKAYETQTVFSITQMDLEPGVFWVKGQNGSGKSTFLKCLAGIIPFEGDVRVHQVSLRKQRMLYTRDVSFAEAEPVFPSFLTGNDLINFYKEAKGDIGEVPEVLMKRFNMMSYIKNRVATYSSGMLKKLSLVLAFIGQPKFILLDEPFITLDVDAVNVLQEVISISAMQTSFIISSHQELLLSRPYTVMEIQQQTIMHTNHVLALS